jgi:hypothetical protein
VRVPDRSLEARLLAPAAALLLCCHGSTSPSHSPPPPAGGPVVLYTDTPSAPTSGGEGGQGGYLSIFGRGFGSGGLGTRVRVRIGGVEVAEYRTLGPSRVSQELGVDQLTGQVGALGGAPAGTALPVVVEVDGASSNADQAFTPSGGQVLFVSLSGDDASAVAGDPAHPWRHLQDAAHDAGAYFAMGAGDQVVIRGGAWSDTLGVDGTWMRASLGASARNGTAQAWIHVTAYPGEDVHYTTPAGAPGGIQGPWSAIAGESGNYWAVSNLRMEVSGGATRDAAPVNTQYAQGPWQVVNCELGPWVKGSSTVLNAGGLAGAGDGNRVLGNHIHDIEGTSELQNHGIYVSSLSRGWEIAWNWIHDVPGGSLVQFNDMLGAGTMPGGEPWPGFVGMRVHHNWLERAAKYGLHFADAADELEARAWDNVILRTQLPAFRLNSSAATQDVVFAFNTVYDAMTTFSGTGNGLLRNEGTGDAPAASVRILDNLLALGPDTTPDTGWFSDESGTSSGWSFSGNLYFDAGRGLAPVASDALASSGDPLFADAAAGDLHPAADGPARGAARAAVPFPVADDLLGAVRPAAPDAGALQAP